jgi:hypothetical protein
MNDIAKKCISEKLIKAMADENLKPSEVGNIFRFPPAYISMMKNHKHWGKCPKSSWEAVQKWTNSGEKLREYGEKCSGQSVTPKLTISSVAKKIVMTDVGHVKKEEKDNVLLPPETSPDNVVPAKRIKGKYRLFPIIMEHIPTGYSAGGYVLQKVCKILGIIFWVAVRDKYGKKVIALKSNHQELIDLAEHLSTVIEI